MIHYAVQVTYNVDDATLDAWWDLLQLTTSEVKTDVLCEVWNGTA
jgi:hypothetical protein